MQLPFTRAQFFAVFADYNEAIGPAPLAAYLLGAAMLAALVLQPHRHDRRIAAGLAVMWLWTGVAYHALHFAAINRAAYGFAALFVLQAGLLAWHGVVRGRLRFAAARGAAGCLGWALLAYAALAYPLLGLAAGHRYAELPMFGVAPCPLALFTFGLLLLAEPPLPRSLLVVPFAWALIGGSAALLLGVPQDWPLLASAAVAGALALRPSAAAPGKAA